MSINGVMTLPPASGAVQVPSAMPAFSVSEIRKRTHAIQEVMKGVMKEGTHYGTIPGTPKPSLWKAGAEVLCMTFRLAPMLESHVTVDDPEGEWAYHGHRRDGMPIVGTCVGFFEVEATCTIHGFGGEALSRCSSRCNNREAKYRGLSLYDVRNTIQKMAEKRAFVSAVLMATGASDIFTQDIEDFPELIEGHALPTTTTAKVVEAVEGHQAELDSHAEPKPLPRPGSGSGHGLTPKREAWLRRSAQEARVPEDAVQRCLDFLAASTSKVVGEFFDALAKGKGEAFGPFRAAS